MALWQDRVVHLRHTLYAPVLDWFDARRLAAWPGKRRALSLMWLMLVLHRLSYLAPAIAGSLEKPATPGASALNIGLLAITIAWNVVLFGTRRRWFTGRMIGIEVGVTCLLLFTVIGTVPVEHALTSENWSTRYMYATAGLLGATLKLRWALLAGLPVTASYALAASLVLQELPSLVAGLNSFVWFLIIAHVMCWYLSTQGQALDTLSQQRLQEEATQAGERARIAERLAQHRTLHDTVLATLTAIARGGLDHRADHVKRRCERDASYVRRLIEADGAEVDDNGLQARLAAVVTEVEQQDIRVHYLCDMLRVSPPAGVVEALVGAAREALNNVASHAGSGTAWLTVLCDNGSLTVRVVDRGCGFDPAGSRIGFGLRWSITERIRSAGGTVTITSAPGEGTCVELIWPAPASDEPITSPSPGAADHLHARD